MKIALGFAKAQTFFDFTSLRQGQFLANDGEKTKDFKSIEQGHTEGTFSLPFKIPTLCLVGASPKPQKQKQRQKWHSLRSCLLKSKKHTIVKIFMKSDAKKAVFRGSKVELSLCRS